MPGHIKKNKVNGEAVYGKKHNRCVKIYNKVS